MKKLLLFISIFFVMIMTSACSEEKPGILFNKYPITEDTVMGYENVFAAGTRIYYLILMPEKIHSIRKR